MRKTLFILFVGLWQQAAAQNQWQFTGNFNAGANITFNYGKGQKFPGLKVFAGLSANGIYKNHLMVNYGPSLSIYTKALGANLNPLVSDVQVDFSNSFSFGYSWGHTLSYTKFFRTINTGAYYNMAFSKAYAAIFSTNFILNNNKRNQTVGSFSFSAPGITINYYNDGDFTFDKLHVADNFDRWWTGGLGIFIHNRNNYNYTELSFDQFTGYAPLLYEVSTLLGINLPSYDTSRNNNGKIPPSFNTSAYNIKIYLGRGYAVDAGAIGGLRSGSSGKVWGLQDIIHMKGGFALHPNYDMTRFYFGGTYNHFTSVKFK